VCLQWSNVIPALPFFDVTVDRKSFPTITAEPFVAQQCVPPLRHSGYICDATVSPGYAGCITHWIIGASVQGRANMGAPKSCCRPEEHLISL
jgi:hypothetical protein